MRFKFSNGWDIDLINVKEDDKSVVGYAESGKYWLEFIKNENKIITSFYDRGTKNILVVVGDVSIV